MKILFYDVRNFELNYILDKVPNNIEPYFIKTPLNDCTYINENHCDADALSVFVSSDLDKKVLKKFKNLKYIFLRCVGYSNVDLEYCKKNNIKIFNTPNYGNSTVAEYVFALLLALARKINKSQKALSTGLIDQDYLMGIELNSKTIGVIGAGAIGRRVINIAYGFQMNVLVYDVQKKGAYDFVELDELLEKSDIISINCPLNSATKKLISTDAFNKMKNSAILINTARGEIVDSRALYDAIVNKKILGAAIDVIECEQTLCQSYNKCHMYNELSDECLKKFFFAQKLMQLDNVIITPHVAYDTKEAQIRILKIALDNIQSTFNINSSNKNLVLI